MTKPVCVVAGVGPENGTGAEIARRFSTGNYRVAMIARDAQKLRSLADKLEDAEPYPCDIANLTALETTLSTIREEMGAPSVVIHNAPYAVHGSILELDPEELEKCFRVNTTALLTLARATLPDMLNAGSGALLVTGNTAATRGKSDWGFFASTKAAQRILAESIAREFGPRGVHVAYFIIDAAIDTPRTRPILAPDKPDDFFAKPAAIAEEMFRVAHQDKSTWSFQVELRPFSEVW